MGFQFSIVARVTGIAIIQTNGNTQPNNHRIRTKTRLSSLNFTPGTIGDDHYSRLKDPNIDLFQLLISLYTAHAAADIKQVRVIQARTLTSGPEFTGEAVSLKGISKYHLLVQQPLAKLPYIFTQL